MDRHFVLYFQCQWCQCQVPINVHICRLEMKKKRKRNCGINDIIYRQSLCPNVSGIFPQLKIMSIKTETLKISSGNSLIIKRIYGISLLTFNTINSRQSICTIASNVVLQTWIRNERWRSARCTIHVDIIQSSRNT